MRRSRVAQADPLGTHARIIDAIMIAWFGRGGDSPPSLSLSLSPVIVALAVTLIVVVAPSSMSRRMRFHGASPWFPSRFTVQHQIRTNPCGEELPQALVSLRHTSVRTRRRLAASGTR